LVRIAGVDLPRNKSMDIALTYIYSIGRSSAIKIMEKAGIDPTTKSDKISEDDASKIREIIAAGHTVEGDLRKEVIMNIKRLMDLGNYRGLRHRKSLPCRGQRTHTNARTRKGPKRNLMKKKK